MVRSPVSLLSGFRFPTSDFLRASQRLKAPWWPRKKLHEGQYPFRIRENLANQKCWELHSPWKLTWHLKIGHPKRKLTSSTFRCVGECCFSFGQIAKSSDYVNMAIVKPTPCFYNIYAYILYIPAPKKTVLKAANRKETLVTWWFMILIHMALSLQRCETWSLLIPIMKRVNICDTGIQDHLSVNVQKLWDFALFCDLFGLVKWPFQRYSKVRCKWPPTRGWKGRFESPVIFPIGLP